MVSFFIAGAGIGGLSTALALARMGQADTEAQIASPSDIDIHLFERAPQLQAVGAGLQLGPNAVRRLRAWGLGPALDRIACQPECLRLHNAKNPRTLTAMALGERMQKRYGAPYLTLLRADLQSLLLQALQKQGLPAAQTPAATGITLHLDRCLTHWQPHDEGVQIQTQSTDGSSATFEGQALIAANGVWSPERQALQSHSPLQATGHWVFRTLIDRADVDPKLDQDAVHVWLGPRLHAAAYAVNQGRQFNVVLDLNLDAAPAGSLRELAAEHDWRQAIDARHVRQAVRDALGRGNPQLQACIEQAVVWWGWRSFACAPLNGPQHVAQGRLALLGDAAHPLLPHWAQGAALAIEDADALAQAWIATRSSTQSHQTGADGIETALQRYAQQRWTRAAQVQARSQRNLEIFQMQGLGRWARNWALRLGGPTLLDTPWLYAY